MKVGGKTALTKNSKSLTLKSGDESIDLILTAVPMGWREKILKTKAFVFPEPPKKPLKDSKGKVIRREDGTAESSRTKRPRIQGRHGGCGRSTPSGQDLPTPQGRPSVSFESVEPVSLNTDEWLKFSRDVLSELGQFGLTEAEIVSIDYLGDKLSVPCGHGQGQERFFVRREPGLPGVNGRASASSTKGMRGSIPRTSTSSSGHVSFSVTSPRSSPSRMTKTAPDVWHTP